MADRNDWTPEKIAERRAILQPGCPDAQALDEIERLQARVARKDRLLRQALSAIETLDDGVLGYGEEHHGDGLVEQWELRDELAAKIRTVLGEDN